MLSVFLALQVVVAPLLAIGEVYPDFLLVGVIVSAMRHGMVPAVITGFIAGLLQDAAVSHLYGLHSLAKSVAGFAAGYAAKNKAKFDLQLTAMIALAAALSHYLVRDIIYHFGDAGHLFYVLVRFVLPNTLYTIAMMAIVQMVWPSGLVSKSLD